MKPLVAALLFLSLNAYVYYYFANEEIYPERTSFAAFPNQVGQWACSQRLSMGPKVEKVLSVTDYLLCEFTNPAFEAPVGVYLGYHQSQVRKAGGQNANFIHPPKHCMPGSGWEIIQAEQIKIRIPGLPGGTNTVNRFVIAKGDTRQLTYYWYQSRGRVIADDWKKVVYLFWDRMTRHRTDGSLLRFTIPLSPDQGQTSDQAFRDIARKILPLLSAYVPN